MSNDKDREWAESLTNKKVCLVEVERHDLNGKRMLKKLCVDKFTVEVYEPHEERSAISDLGNLREIVSEMLGIAMERGREQERDHQLTMQYRTFAGRLDIQEGCEPEYCILVNGSYVGIGQVLESCEGSEIEITIGWKRNTTEDKNEQ